MESVVGNKVPWTRGQKLVLRIVVMGGIIAALVWWDLRPEHEADAPAANISVRVASAAEWQADLAALGEQRCALSIPYQVMQVSFADDYQGPRPPQVEAKGLLVRFWYDGRESMTYVQAPGETQMDGLALMRALSTRQGAWVIDDDGLTERMMDVAWIAELPTGWTVLRPPGG